MLQVVGFDSMWQYPDTPFVKCTQHAAQDLSSPALCLVLTVAPALLHNSVPRISSACALVGFQVLLCHAHKTSRQVHVAYLSNKG